MSNETYAQRYDARQHRLKIWTAAALTGYIAAGMTPKTAAEQAVRAAAVMEQEWLKHNH